jgi:uncharacterized oxidoreductase
MNISGNVILITGGGSGIGRGLAEAFHKLGNQVIISGRNQKALDETASANPGMKSFQLDIQDPADIKSFAQRVTKDFPNLNVLINNAGIMRIENLTDQPEDLNDATEIVETNLLGPIRLTAALLPLLRKQPNAVIMNNSSGLAFVPLAMTPTYCATKAAIHSYTESLRYQLKSSGIQVIELVPPYVATSLLADATKNDPRAMPLNEFISEVMDILKNQPNATELCVQRVHLLRFAAEGGQYQKILQGLNDSFAAAAAGH